MTETSDAIQRAVDKHMQLSALHARVHAPQKPPRVPRGPACAACGWDGSARFTSSIGPVCAPCSYDADSRPKTEFRDVLAWRYTEAAFSLRDMRKIKIIPGLADRTGFRFFCEVPGAKPSGLRFNYTALQPPPPPPPLPQREPPPVCDRPDCTETLRRGDVGWWCPTHDRASFSAFGVSGTVSSIAAYERDDQGRLKSTLPRGDLRAWLARKVHG